MGLKVPKKKCECGMTTKWYDAKEIGDDVLKDHWYVVMTSDKFVHIAKYIWSRACGKSVWCTDANTRFDEVEFIMPIPSSPKTLEEKIVDLMSAHAPTTSTARKIIKLVKGE